MVIPTGRQLIVKVAPRIMAQNPLGKQPEAAQAPNSPYYFIHVANKPPHYTYK